MQKFEEILEHEFSDKNLLRTALTHSSFANEKKDDKIISNERLEFFGDSILSLIVSEYVYNKFPKLPEGELTRIRANVVCEQSLAEMAKLLKIGDFLMLGKGEELTGGRYRNSILSDSFEAVLAALYLDTNLEFVKKWAINMFEKIIHKAEKGKLYTDYKTTLQENIQKTTDEPLIYTVVSQTGPDHEKLFCVEVKIGDKIIGSGEGKSKKEAEQNAAKEALSNSLKD